MNVQESLRIISRLADGYHPATNQPLPPGSIYQDAEIIRALFAASLALADVESRDKRRELLPRNTGKAWSEEEDRILVEAFDSGVSLKQIAAAHQRSTTAIRLRLSKFGRETDSSSAISVS